MWGFSLEAAYHIDLSDYVHNGWELVPFYRYTYENLQTGGFAGTDRELANRSGSATISHSWRRSVPDATTRFETGLPIRADDAPDSPRADHLLGAVGFFF